MSKLAPVLVSILIGTTSIFALGCGGNHKGGSSGGGGSSQGAVGEHDEVAITAKKGGKISGTGVTATIPAGALAKDTTITIDIKDKAGYANASNIAVDVYDFGPNGTKFLKPVSMTIDLGGATAPKGMTAVIAYYDGKAWQPLSDSAVSGGKVTATTTHFTPFTIVWSNGMQTGGGCASLDFTPCGGDLSGTWSFSAACIDLPPGQTDPTGGHCPQATATATVDFSGTITLNSDKTYSLNDSTTASITFVVPDSCLTSNGTTCSAQSGKEDGSGNCTVTKPQTPSQSSESGTYVTSGTTLTTTKTGGSASSPVDYCVQGTTLKVKQTKSDGSVTMFVADKQ